MGKNKVKYLFILYCAVMLWLMFGQRIGGSNAETYAEALRLRLNLIPFRTIHWFATVGDKTSDAGLLRHAFINLAGNVVMFVPLGFFLPCIWERVRAVWKTFLWGLLLITVAELLQLLTLLGSCDVDDLILNLLGILLGYGIWKLTALLQNRKS